MPSLCLHKVCAGVWALVQRTFALSDDGLPEQRESENEGGRGSEEMFQPRTTFGLFVFGTRTRLGFKGLSPLVRLTAPFLPNSTGGIGTTGPRREQFGGPEPWHAWTIDTNPSWSCINGKESARAPSQVRGNTPTFVNVETPLAGVSWRGTGPPSATHMVYMHRATGTGTETQQMNGEIERNKITFCAKLGTVREIPPPQELTNC